jgi:hypothetical protein
MTLYMAVEKFDPSALHALGKCSTRNMLASVVALNLALISGCGQEAPPAPKADTRTAAQKKADEIYNPTPEQKAQQEAARQARIDADKPRRMDFADPGVADESKYVDVGATFVAYKVYNALRDWEESPADIAKSTFVLQQYNGVDPRIPPISKKLQTVSDAFEKSDAEKQLAGIAAEISQPYKETRWVKISLPSKTIGMIGYDFGLKGFVVAKELFTDKLSYTDLDRKFSSYSDPHVQPIKAYVNNAPTDYKIGFTGVSDKTLIKVEDEQLARKIETARPEANVEFYGYIESVQRRRLNGQDQKERYILIHPQKIVIHDGKTNEVLLSTSI